MADDNTIRCGSTARTEPDLGEAIQQLVVGWRVFGRYLLEAPLGRGGLSVVWKAHDELLDESVALKFMAEVVVEDETAVNDLRQKTAQARALADPNIVRVNDFMRDNTLATVSMEYVEGASLEKLRLEQPNRVLPIATLAPLVRQICAALDYAHGTAKIVHRGLKPTNILVTRDGVAKITDFGVGSSLTEARLRLSGETEPVPGTMCYMSPQQLDGGAPVPADDIYAFGAILYELLTGEPPFSAGDTAEQIRTREPVTIAARRAGSGVAGEPVPLAWKKTVAACLAKNPVLRPATGDEIARLLGLAAGTFEAAEPTSPSDPSRDGDLLAQPAIMQAAPALPTWLGSEPPAPAEKMVQVAGPEKRPLNASGSAPPVAPEAVSPQAIEALLSQTKPVTPAAPVSALPELKPDQPTQAASPAASRASKSPYASKTRSAIHYPTPKEAQREADELAAQSEAEGKGKRSLVGRVWKEFLRY